jgi:hypothetical protein
MTLIECKVNFFFFNPGFPPGTVVDIYGLFAHNGALLSSSFKQDPNST